MAEFFEAWVILASNWLGIEDLEYAGAGPLIALVTVILGLVGFYFIFKLAIRPLRPLFHGETLADYGRIQEPKPKRMRERTVLSAVADEDVNTVREKEMQVDDQPVATTPVVRILPLDDFVRGDGIDREIARELADGLHATLKRVPNLQIQKACLSSPTPQPCGNGKSSIYVVAGTVKRTTNGAHMRLCLKDATSGERIWSRNEDVSPDDVASLSQEIAIEIGGAVILRQGSAHTLLERASPRAVTRKSNSTYPSDHPQELEPAHRVDQPAA